MWLMPHCNFNIPKYDSEVNRDTGSEEFKFQINKIRQGNCVFALAILKLQTADDRDMATSYR